MLVVLPTVKPGKEMFFVSSLPNAKAYRPEQAMMDVARSNDKTLLIVFFNSLTAFNKVKF